MQPDPASGTSGKHPMRILIVDDHEIFRAAFRALLRTQGMDVIADVPAGSTAITTAIALRPEVAIVDVTPADDTGMGIVRRLATLPRSPGHRAHLERRPPPVRLPARRLPVRRQGRPPRRGDRSHRRYQEGPS